jgi:esterase/lipase
MNKALFGFLRFLVLLYFMVGGLLYLLQDKLLYHPSEAVEHDHTEKIIESDGLELKVVVLNEGKEKGILYFGGNGESVVNSAKQRAENFSDYTVYLVNYRGYGGNDGKPSKEGLYADALVAYDTFKKEHKELYLMGRSLGSSVASYVASQREVKKIVMITPFDSLVNVAQSKYPMYPIDWILKDKYDNVENLSGAKNTEVLIMMADADKIVPNERTMVLVEALDRSRTELEVIKGFVHNNLQKSEGYYSKINTFLGK